MKRNKPTLALLFLSMLYITICFFVFLLIADVLIDLFFSGQINISAVVLKKIVIISLIAGVAVGTGGYLFSKIDEQKARKSKNTDP
ncbi:hypothetical protein [Pectobacterium carotovorum]|uniref:hypothetical protein n=1 Tax=Pectobacterium carotovorum TaxID=554 RepID=UPI002B059C87|nr:hypothetical protein [Pectobacterium carotovorum]